VTNPDWSPPARRCDECCRHEPISIRGRDGQPELCHKCARNKPAVCAICGEHRRCYSAHEGPSVCRRCAPDPHPRCSRCAKRKRIATITDRGPVCVGCERAAARGRPRCRNCRFSRPPAAWVDGEPLCSTCAGVPAIAHCPGCHQPRQGWRGGRCPRCELTDLLAELRADGDPEAVATLEPLLGQLECYQKPLSAVAWLKVSPAATTFHAMLRGELGISHDSLDEHDLGQATAYLRSWLVAHHILAPREERFARYEHWAQHALQALADHPDRAHLTAYARWELGAGYARKLRTGQARQSTHKAYYANLRVAISFTRWLHENDLTLEQTRQAQLDHWLTGPPSRALPTRAFLNWAHTAGLIPALHISRPAPRTSNTPIDHATRLQQARALLHDDDIEPSIRITGTLLLLYGQLITRLVQLRTTDIQIDHHNNVQLRLGADPIAVAEPLATLLRDQRQQATDSWLFPGAKPGTHIGPERIRRRLRQLGISPRTARPGALLALAITVPAPILAELLGYHNDTTNHWRREAAGDWARYAHLASTPTT
jgi:hypothetical protein